MIIVEDLVTNLHTNPSGAHKINFQVKSGEIFFLVGGSSSGKSTLFKLLLGLEKISSGKIIIDGQNLVSISAKQRASLRRKLGIITQQPNLCLQKTVYENVGLPLFLEGCHRKSAELKIRFVLQKLDLESLQNKRVAQLSLSEQQKLVLARALVKKPKLIIADEPTYHLDYQSSMRFYSLIEEYKNEGSAILILTHDLTKIASMKYPLLCFNKSSPITGN